MHSTWLLKRCQPRDRRTGWNEVRPLSTYIRFQTPFTTQMLTSDSNRVRRKEKAAATATAMRSLRQSDGRSTAGVTAPTAAPLTGRRLWIARYCRAAQSG
eukprot:366278-Chlamydomonas_euryale.AAC.13